MATPSFITDNRSADLVRLIVDGAIFLRPRNSGDIPTGPDWIPADPDGTCIGYYSQDGLTLTPNPGTPNEFAAHNSDIVLERQADGAWGVQFSGIEARPVVISAYFDVDKITDPQAPIYVRSAAANKYYDLAIIGVDQDDRKIVVHAPRVKISEREALNFNTTNLLASGLTLNTSKATGHAGEEYHLAVWGSALFEADSSPVSPGSSPLSSPVSPSSSSL